MKDIENQHAETTKAILVELLRRGHVSAAVSLLRKQNCAAWILKGEMTVSSWDAVDTPCRGGWGDRIDYNTSQVPDGYEFSDDIWKLLFEYAPESVTDWICEVFEEEGP